MSQSNEMNRLFIIIGLVLSSILPLWANSPTTAGNDSTRVLGLAAAEDSLPAGALKTIEVLDFKNADLSDVLRGIGTKYGLNIFVDDQIRQQVTVHLVAVKVHEALDFFARQYELELERNGNIFEFRRPFIAEPEPPPLLISYDETGRMSLDIKNEDLRKVVEEISKQSGKNVVLNQGVQGTVSGFIQNLPFTQGLQTLMNINGFEIREQEGVFLVERQPRQESRNGAGQPGRSFRVSIEDSLVSLDVSKASIRDVLREIFVQIDRDLVLYEEVKGEITAHWSQIPFDDALTYLLKGTEFTFRKENEVYLVGGKNLQGIISTRLIRLSHLRADQVMELLPESIKKGTSIQLMKEHNGIVVLGAETSIQAAENFILEIDRPIPQVLIEAIVVDFNHQDIGEFGISAGIGSTVDTGPGIVNSLFPMIDVAVNGGQINTILDDYGGGFGLGRIAKLPDDFYLQIKALESEGKANVRSRPQIATLSGHTASISIGTTQYFILKTETPISGSNQVVLQQSERFETIKAEMVLEVTPWVTATGEIIAEIRPEFSTPKNGLNSSVPPTIDHRVLDSTIKLKDGETIVLGGLIQEFDAESISKFPLLGDIPLLGKLFRSRSYNKSKSELIIYLTPHIYYVGDELSPMQGSVR